MNKKLVSLLSRFRFTALVAAVFVLSACANGGRPNSLVAVYDFGLPAERLPGDSRRAGLALEVRSPQWFDSMLVNYRLAYDDSLKLRQYSGSRWAGPPAQLIGQGLRQQLGLVASTGGGAGGCLLRLDLQEFSQVFDTPEASQGVLQGSLTLIDGRRRLLAERPLQIRQPARSADARGGVVALAATSEAAGREIAGWLATLASEGRLNECPGQTSPVRPAP